jgi:hypothetical protein
MEIYVIDALLKNMRYVAAAPLAVNAKKLLQQLHHLVTNSAKPTRQSSFTDVSLAKFFFPIIILWIAHTKSKDSVGQTTAIAICGMHAD